MRTGKSVYKTILSMDSGISIEGVFNRARNHEEIVEMIDHYLTEEGRVTVGEWTNSLILNIAGEIANLLCMIQNAIR